jgi:hypothetical protein
VILKENSVANELKKLLSEKYKILITTHLNPDGDAMGSTLALSMFLKKAGHDVSLIVPNEYPEFLQWLPGNKDVIDFYKRKEFAKSIISSADIIFFLDYNEFKRGGDMHEVLTLSNALKVMIDHHPNPQMKVDFQLSFTVLHNVSIQEYLPIQAVSIIIRPEQEHLKLLLNCLTIPFIKTKYTGVFTIIFRNNVCVS